jgi:phospho-N-acetylmuramoyl-pentapeptide-transferase
MEELLGLVLISFAITSLLLVPFIDLLFYLRERFRRQRPSSSIDQTTPIHNKLLVGKDKDTPVGGGILLIPVVIILSLIFIFFYQRSPDFSFIETPIYKEVYVLIFTFLSFGLIGLIDDVRKIFSVFSGKYSGLRARYLFLLQFICATIIAFWLFYQNGLNNIFIPIWGNVILDWVYIPLAIGVIMSFTNAFNISDGLDGLSTGLLAICLFAFLVLAHSVFNPTLSIFVGVWIGALIAFLYFNVYPARIYLGDAGAFGFGAALAVVGLLSGKIIGLGVIGGVYIVIVASSFLQLISKRFFKKKLFPLAPIHMYFRYIGWEEPKVVMRFWLAGAVFAILGLWLALLSK